MVVKKPTHQSPYYVNQQEQGHDGRHQQQYDDTSNKSPTKEGSAQQHQQQQEQQSYSRDDYAVSQTLAGPEACHKIGLDDLGINNPSLTIYRNLTYDELWEHENANANASSKDDDRVGYVANTKYGEVFGVDTGKYTGRSPKDKFFVLNPDCETQANIDWNENQPTSPEVFDELYARAVAFFNGTAAGGGGGSLQRIYVFDGYCGADPATRKKVRFVFEMAWQLHFVTNMLIRPTSSEELEDFEPDFTVLNCCSQVVNDWQDLEGLNSETAVMFNVEQRKAVVFGTWYGGENKKGVFSLMNYWLPMAGHLSMHCSANVGRERGDVALFFGLSGTGKTTLSADPHRALIGDDEHGWDSHGVFNLEGGCYAKTINLSEATEPDIYRAIRRDALLENVVLLDDGSPDYSDTSKTENGRVSYPIFHIDGFHEPQTAGHPSNIIFLSCDAFGVLPPVARLDSGQAMYHFLSGYTAKVAGTERGIVEPVATFSACFGAAFMTLHPTRYADLLQAKLDELGGSCHTYLVNSGWSGGPYGVGERMSIHTTRTCIDAILDGSIQSAEFSVDPIFGFEVPKSLPGLVDDGDNGEEDAAARRNVLDPRSTWQDPDAYDVSAHHLARMYADNFRKYEGRGTRDYTQYGPRIQSTN